MKIRPLFFIVTLLGLQAISTAQAQPTDTLQKIKDSGVIHLGGMLQVDGLRCNCAGMAARGAVQVGLARPAYP